MKGMGSTCGPVSYTHLDVYKRQARSMVMKYGMSDKLGLICYGDDDDEVFIGRDPVSYTHLDVYKRQALSERLSEQQAG